MPEKVCISIALLLILAAGSAASPQPADLSLPAGDAEQGRRAFLALRCNGCHRVAGADLPAPVASPPVPITLGEAPWVRTDAQLVTSIVNPSHAIARAEYGELVASGKLSRMGDYTKVMTVRQLVDIVAFLRKHGRR